MLRESVKATGTRVDLRGVVFDVDPLVEHGRHLVALASAVVRRDAAALMAARDALENSIGRPAAAAAVAVTATFEMMNRIVDGTGLPINPATRAAAAQLGLRDGTAR